MPPAQLRGDGIEIDGEASRRCLRESSRARDRAIRPRSEIAAFSAHSIRKICAPSSAAREISNEICGRRSCTASRRFREGLVDLIADRFLVVDQESTIDLATGDRVELVVSASGGVAEQSRWAARCERFARSIINDARLLITVPSENAVDTKPGGAMVPGEVRVSKANAREATSRSCSGHLDGAVGSAPTRSGSRTVTRLFFQTREPATRPQTRLREPMEGRRCRFSASRT